MAGVAIAYGPIVLCPQCGDRSRDGDMCERCRIVRWPPSGKRPGGRAYWLKRSGSRNKPHGMA